MSWTINENSKTSTTEYFNANYSDSVPVGATNTVTTAFTSQNAISGYSSGTISFTIDQPPSAWGGGENMIFIVMGKIDTNIFIASSQQKTVGNTPPATTTFYVEWDIPLEDVALRIVNNSGVLQNIENIRIQTESSGGGASGVHSSSGSEVGPGGLTPEIQFNDGGIFGGAKGALYDSTTEQIKLANGSVSEPMLAFSDGTHPNGNYDTGIYRIANDAIGISCGNSSIVGIHGTAPGNFIKGLNIGQTNNICGIRRLSNNSRNSWEDGHMGNSLQLVFTGSDFTNFNTRIGATTPFAISTGGRAFGIVSSIAAPPQGDEFIAVKMIPKGFKIIPRRIVVTTSNGSGTVWGSSGLNPPTIQLLIQDIDNTLAPPPNPIPLTLTSVPMTSWNAAGLNSQYTPLINLDTNPGNGTRALIVKIKVFNVQITVNDPLVGVAVLIERV
ncbi:hypothetical protein OAK19_03110 [Aureispira]|nr:hypothetical protein [Aureispira sp.]